MICSWRLYCLYFDHTGDAGHVGARDCEGEEGQGGALGGEEQEPEEDWVSAGVIGGEMLLRGRLELALDVALERGVRRGLC